MPILLEKNQTFKVILESDKNKEVKPAFIFRALSCMELREISRSIDNLSQSKTSDESFDIIFGNLKKSLVGWENMIEPSTDIEISFDVKDIERILTVGEALELVKKIQQQGFGITDLKN